MQVSVFEWVISLSILIIVLGYDLRTIVRHPHEPDMRECVLRLGWYICLAGLFGLWTVIHHGGICGAELLTSWLTEYSLSLDNLFVFIVILNTFKVPLKYRQETLFMGIILALLLRGICIGLGALAIQRISWIFYLFGVVMLVTAWRMIRDEDVEECPDNYVVQWIKKHLPTTDEWMGWKFLTHTEHGWAITPILLVVLTLGTADIVFAMDSIPAVFGITHQPYLVATASICALMGLQQLYFILGVLLHRFAYLSYGLALVVAFIGVRMIMQALVNNSVPFIHHGKGLEIPEIPVVVSLCVIVIVLCGSIVVSLYKTRNRGSNLADKVK